MLSMVDFNSAIPEVLFLVVYSKGFFQLGGICGSGGRHDAEHNS